MPVYLICEIFSKKYIFDKNIQKNPAYKKKENKKTTKKRRKRNARKSNENGY